MVELDDDLRMSKLRNHLNADIGEALQGQVGDVGWDTMVHSMRGAIEDRSHAIHLGVAVGVLLFVWGNYLLAKWVLKSLSDKVDVSKLK